MPHNHLQYTYDRMLLVPCTYVLRIKLYVATLDEVLSIEFPVASVVRGSISKKYR